MRSKSAARNLYDNKNAPTGGVFVIVKNSITKKKPAIPVCGNRGR